MAASIPPRLIVDSAPRGNRPYRRAASYIAPVPLAHRVNTRDASTRQRSASTTIDLAAMCQEIPRAPQQDKSKIC